MIDLLVNNDIDLYCLPPHTTNILQPLDVSVFRPLKTAFSNITDLVKLASLATKSPLTVSKKSFTPLFKEAYERALSVSTIKKGFRKCGIVPFDPEAIDKKRLMPNNNAAPNLPSTTSTDAADIDLSVNIDLTTTTDNVHCTTDDATMADPVKIEPQ